MKRTQLFYLLSFYLGIDIEPLENGSKFTTVLNALIKQGYLKFNGADYELTSKGMRVIIQVTANDLFEDLTSNQPLK